MTQAFPFLAPGLTAAPLQIKEGRGILQWLSIDNPNAGSVFIQAFDVAAGTEVTLGTTVPNASFAIGPGAAGILPIGMAFINGLKIAATTTIKGNTAPAMALDCTVGIN